MKNGIRAGKGVGTDATAWQPSLTRRSVLAALARISRAARIKPVANFSAFTCPDSQKRFSQRTAGRS
jgi:hypothetical protein